MTAETREVPARPGIAERLAAMIQLPTVSAEREATGPAPFAAFVALLAELYPLVQQHLPLERIGEFGLVYRWAGGNDEAHPIVLMAHYDVVPVSEQDWSVPAFEGRIADGYVWGRGALDDKGSLCTLLDAVENLLAQGWQPPRPVLICLGPDEEMHGTTGRLIANTFRDRGVRPWLVLDEGGAITEVPFPGVSGSFAMVGLAEKGVMNVELTAHAEGGHASAPSGVTAVGRIAAAVARLNRNPFEVRMSATVATLLAGLADQAEPKYATAWRLAARTPALAARVLARAGGPDGAALVQTTLAATMLAGGSSPNVLPSQASATLNLRVNVGETSATVVERLRAVIKDPLVEVRCVEADEPTGESPADNAQFDLIRAAVEASYPGIPTLGYLTMAATDARHWHRFTEAVYRFSPLAMPGPVRAGIHGVDERVAVDSLVRGERFYRAVLKGLP